MQSIFGTTRTKPAFGRVASSEYAIINVGGNTELLQSVNGQYGRQVQTYYEIGTPNVNWVPGSEEGSLSISRLVGKGGFFDGWQGNECGVISPVSINLSGGPCIAVARGGLQFQDAMIVSVAFQIATTPGIMESMEMKIGMFARV
jgi:hypothetical protein